MTRDRADEGATHGKSSERPIVVWAAISANVLIAAAKFAAAAVTGSSAMISEGIHSVVDSANQGLLLLGLHRSRKPPDEMHPFGHGMELYFWGLVVAIALFGVGGGMSFYEGIRHIVHPSPLESPLPNYVVLGIAALAEGTSWTLALRKLHRHRRPGETFFAALQGSKDPSTFVVLLEDSAALAGIAIAALGLFLSHRLGLPVLDGVASLGIGVLLASVAFFLAHECRNLLVGEAAHPAVQREIRSAMQRRASVHEVRRILTMQLAPDEVLVNADVRFAPDLDAHLLADEIRELEREIHQANPSVRKVFIEAVDEERASVA